MRRLKFGLSRVLDDEVVAPPTILSRVSPIKARELSALHYGWRWPIRIIEDACSTDKKDREV